MVSTQTRKRIPYISSLNVSIGPASRDQVVSSSGYQLISSRESINCCMTYLNRRRSTQTPIVIKVETDQTEHSNIEKNLPARQNSAIAIDPTGPSRCLIALLRGTNSDVECPCGSRNMNKTFNAETPCSANMKITANMTSKDILWSILASAAAEGLRPCSEETSKAMHIHTTLRPGIQPSDNRCRAEFRYEIRRLSTR
ncbi:hypothetical protein KCV07_g141, partial [Aureobasidium melanogenum]